MVSGKAITSVLEFLKESVIATQWLIPGTLAVAGLLFTEGNEIAAFQLCSVGFTTLTIGHLVVLVEITEGRLKATKVNSIVTLWWYILILFSLLPVFFALLNISIMISWVIVLILFINGIFYFITNVLFRRFTLFY